MSITTGKTDSTLGPIYHATLSEAEAWIEQRAKSDPEGVERGDYYLDAPEELLVRERLLHEPSVSNEEYGRLVEEAAEADEARALADEEEHDRREQLLAADAEEADERIRRALGERITLYAPSRERPVADIITYSKFSEEEQAQLVHLIEDAIMGSRVDASMSESFREKTIADLKALAMKVDPRLIEADFADFDDPRPLPPIEWIRAHYPHETQLVRRLAEALHAATKETTEARK